MEFQMAYQRANEILDREIKLLFQRFNFFLVGTGILFAAYATFVTDNGLSGSTYPKYIPILVASVGLGFSILIASFNYLNSRMIFKIGSYISSLEGIPSTIRSVDTKDSKTPNNSFLIEDITMLPQNHISNITQNIINEGTLIRMIPPLFIAELFGNIHLKLKDSRIPLITASQYAFFLPFLLANVWIGILGSITSMWSIFICFMAEGVALIIFFLIVILFRALPSDAFPHIRRNIPLP